MFYCELEPLILNLDAKESDLSYFVLVCVL